MAAYRFMNVCARERESDLVMSKVFHGPIYSAFKVHVKYPFNGLQGSGGLCFLLLPVCSVNTGLYSTNKDSPK